MRENAAQRQTMADLLGQVRELDHGHTEEQVQRLLTLNTDLKRQVRDLSETNRTLTERLDAARSHARFLDKRVADLEVELVEPVRGEVR